MAAGLRSTPGRRVGIYGRIFRIAGRGRHLRGDGPRIHGALGRGEGDTRPREHGGGGSYVERLHLNRGDEPLNDERTSGLEGLPTPWIRQPPSQIPQKPQRPRTIGDDSTQNGCVPPPSFHVAPGTSPLRCSSTPPPAPSRSANLPFSLSFSVSLLSLAVHSIRFLLSSLQNCV